MRLMLQAWNREVIICYKILQLDGYTGDIITCSRVEPPGSASELL